MFQIGNLNKFCKDWNSNLCQEDQIPEGMDKLKTKRN